MRPRERQGRLHDGIRNFHEQNRGACLDECLKIKFAYRSTVLPSQAFSSSLQYCPCNVLDMALMTMLVQCLFLFCAALTIAAPSQPKSSSIPLHDQPSLSPRDDGSADIPAFLEAVAYHHVKYSRSIHVNNSGVVESRDVARKRNRHVPKAPHQNDRRGRVMENMPLTYTSGIYLNDDAYTGVSEIRYQDHSFQTRL